MKVLPTSLVYDGMFVNSYYSP